MHTHETNPKAEIPPDPYVPPKAHFERLVLALPFTEAPKRLADHQPGTLVFDQGNLLLVLAWASELADCGMPAPFLYIHDDRDFDGQNIPYVMPAELVGDCAAVVPGRRLKHVVAPISDPAFTEQDATDFDGHLRLHNGVVEIVTSELGNFEQRWAVNPVTWTVSKPTVTDRIYGGLWMWEIEASDRTTILRVIQAYNNEDHPGLEFEDCEAGVRDD